MIEHGTEYLSLWVMKELLKEKNTREEVNFSNASKKYKDFLKKHKVATFK